MRLPFVHGSYRLTALTLVVGLLGAGGYLFFQAPAAPALPRLRPARLLASTLKALEQPYSISGRVSSDVHLSRSFGGRGNGSLSHATYRVWRSPDGLRVAQILDLGERLLVANPSEAWLWDSSTLTATRLSAQNVTSSGFDFTPAIVSDPLAFTKSLLKTIAPYSKITIDGTASIAGRPAYLLRLESQQRYTMLKRVVVGIDARTRLPLMIRLYTHHLKAPAVDIEFTSVSFGHLDPSLFQFTPPSKASVVKATIFHGSAQGGLARSTQTKGHGWKTVVMWQLAHQFSRTALAALPFATSIGSALTVRAHGKTWLLAGFVHLLRLQRLALHLSA